MNTTPISRSRIAILAAMLLAPLSAFGQGGITLANPHWNITLTDFGYSDFLLDNTPGFEGREYLSGEWGAAVGYEVSDGASVKAQWLEAAIRLPELDDKLGFHRRYTAHANGAECRQPCRSRNRSSRMASSKSRSASRCSTWRPHRPPRNSKDRRRTKLRHRHPQRRAGVLPPFVSMSRLAT